MLTKLSSSKLPQRRDAQAVVTRATSSRPLVLVVEDHRDTRDLLRYMLMARGFGVAEAENGEDAIVMAERLRPGLILMDAS
ncbi:MAG TPA: response regulator, partial [Pyrinomonadaceae bacterium]|nr:response regulator [Pyrinomonadaceae bacterium]